MKKQGFTLIELLIVIGVLGILATGLMAAVDPFEQLKKARDANNRNAVVELYNASTRYYATHGSFPWDLDTDTGTAGTQYLTGCSGVSTAAGLFGASRSTDPTPVALSGMQNCITALEGDGELKTGFLAALGATADKMFITSSGLTQVTVCFAPEGKALWKDVQTKYNKQATDCGTTACTGTYAADCTVTTKNAAASSEIGAVNDNSCFWCVR